MTQSDGSARTVAAGVAVTVVLLLVLSFVSASAVAPAAPPGASAAPALVPVVASAATPHHPAPPGTGAPSSGRGVFWNNSLLAQAPATNDSCAYTSWPSNFAPGTFCTNDTAGPSIASTSAGVMVTAATSFTNVSSCPVDRNLTYSEIAVSISTNGGSSFAAPHYLSNPGCLLPFEFTSAMSPVVTALSDGTFVLAYLEYNASADNRTGCPFSYGMEEFPAPIPCVFSHDRLVVTESSNNGVSWSTPTVINSTNNPHLNASAPIPAQPAIASFGNTVYLAWTNFTFPDFEDYYQNPPPAPSIGLNLVVSLNGGSTWGAPKQLPVVPGAGTYSNGEPWVAYAPALAVTAKGVLAVAYSTNYTEQTSVFCQPSGCGYLDYGAEGTMSVVVATSKDNGTTFKLTTVADAVPAYWNGEYETWISGGAGSLLSPEPAIAVNPSTGEMFVAFTGGAIGTVCSTTGCAADVEEFENLWVSNSTNGGTSWSAPDPIGDATLGINGTAAGGGYLFTPSVAVASGGNVYIDVEYLNEGICNPARYCGQWNDLLFESTNNGSTFPNAFAPYAAGANLAGIPFTDGFDTSMTVYQGQPYAAWTWFDCPLGSAFVSACQYLSTSAYSQVIVSSLAVGTGITVSFHQTGLASGFNWSVSLSGNLRAGPSSTTLSVSGVPIGQNETWTVLPVATTVYGVEYSGSIALPSPGAFTANTTLNATFNESVLLNVNTVPLPTAGYPFYCGGTSVAVAFYCGNENITPASGSTWVPAGTPYSYGVYDGGFPSVLCIGCFNYSFVAWSGTGSGSWNTSVANGSTILNGPANETASFSVTSVCLQLPYYACTGLLYAYNFSETGLPVGTAWTVSLGNATNTTSASYHSFWGPAGPVAYTVDTVPYNASYSYVGVPNFPSPVTPAQGDVTIHFNLVANTAERFAVNFTQVGAPSSASGWGLELGSATLGIPLAGETIALPGGGAGVTLNATSVYGNAGVEGTISSFEVTPDVVGASPYVLAPGGSLYLTGPATVTAIYGSSYWLEIPTPAGGTVNQTSQWVANGAPVTVAATPSTGFSFVGWTGTGTGSTTATTPTITVRPHSPVTEVATFAPVATAYTVTVQASGLPSDGDVTFVLGTTSYTGSSPLTISGVLPGTYPIAAPTVAINGTPGEQFLVTGFSSTTLGYSSGELTVSGDGSVTVTYLAQYLLTIAPTVNGTLTPAAGSYWETAGTAVSIEATPAHGFVFVGWVGTGLGAYSGPVASQSVTPAGPVSEAAGFAFNVVPVHLYSLALTPSGLPAGTDWSASIGSTAVTGTGTLTFTLVNGSYTVAVGVVSPSAGVEYVPSAATYSITVSGPTPYTGPTFTTMYLVSISGSTGGSAGTSAWAASGSSVTLSAVAASGYTFEGWNGTGTGSYTGTSPSSSLTVTGPVSEFATFVPSSSLAKSSSGSGGSDLTAIALLVVLLVVGLIVGLLIARSRPPSDGGSGPEEGEADTSSVPVWTDSAEARDAPPAPAGGTEEDSIYGGGSA
jgi:uncharacterized repeat protein (TIGR02543 family)